MSKATEIFHQLDGHLTNEEGPTHPFLDAVSLQLRLAQQVEQLLSEGQQEISIPDELCGTYSHSDRQRPHSSIGEVLYLEGANGERLAVKLLVKLNSDERLQPHHDPTYAFHHPAVRVMTALGESLMGRAANTSPTLPMYFGIAGLRRFDSSGAELSRFSLTDVLQGTAEPAIVMRAMRTSMADALLDYREAADANQPLPYSDGQLREWTHQVMTKVIQTSVALPLDIATQIGSPAEVERLLVGKTIGWLTSRADEHGLTKHPLLVEAVAQARQTRAAFQAFFALPETQEQLAKRAVPESDGKVVQTFSPGDTKLGNVMLGDDGQGREVIGLFDPQWLVLNPGVIGNETHQFAPWPFADLMQIAAYTAAQPAAYGFPDLQNVVYDTVRQYYGDEQWSSWHELYLKILTSYKLLVDVAFAIDPYREKVERGEPIPRALDWILQKHPRTANEVAQRALRVYDGQNE